MKNSVLIITFCTIYSLSFSQSAQYLSTNVVQLSVGTINLNYQIDIHPRFSTQVESGYAFNYQNSFDYFGNLLSQKFDCKDPYIAELSNGAYIKTGISLNFRKSFEKQNYFHLDLSLSESLIHQKGYYVYMTEWGWPSEKFPAEQTYFKTGYGVTLAYNFKFSQRFFGNIGIQRTHTFFETSNSFGDGEYIPGVGFNNRSEYYNLVIIGFKYKINKQE